MGFQSFLLGIFPHRWLNQKAQGNIRLFGGIGNSLDYYFSFVQTLMKETKISTAVDTIPLRESEYGINSDPSLSIEARRGNILARKREKEGPITKDDLISSVKAAYDIDISIQNDFNNSIMTIQMESVIGIPDCLDQMKVYIEEACRAHIGKNFKFRYLRVRDIHLAMTINQLQQTKINNFYGGGSA